MVAPSPFDVVNYLSSCKKLQDLDASFSVVHQRVLEPEQEQQLNENLSNMAGRLNGLTSVTTLDLSGILFRKTVTALVDGLASMPVLTSLELNECGLNDDSVNTLSLSVLRHCPIQ
jgi:hypothetical protein